MPLVRRGRETLPPEDVPKMPPAIAAEDLSALYTHRAVHTSRDSTGDGVEVRGPAASGLEFVRGAVEGGIAAGTGIDALGSKMAIVFALEGGFGATLAKDTKLFLR
jgi:hypothetical protein